MPSWFFKLLDSYALFLVMAHTHCLPQIDLSAIFTQEHPSIDLRVHTYENSMHNFLSALTNFKNCAITTISDNQKKQVAEKKKILEKPHTHLEIPLLMIQRNKQHFVSIRKGHPFATFLQLLPAFCFLNPTNLKVFSSNQPDFVGQNICCSSLLIPSS